jgi:hypothetical protein
MTLAWLIPRRGIRFHGNCLIYRVLDMHTKAGDPTAVDSVCLCAVSARYAGIGIHVFGMPCRPNQPVV